ncbi:HNH endonuclease [Tardiphaga sp.]|jgi:hypothetical protein|uniref:HNH endonuclease n=1 Tax=Tardiphaga sp. TaxID=1926292 RepID=UPI0037D9FE50
MSATREIIAALVAGGMDAVDAATLVATAAVEMAARPAAKVSAGAARMSNYRDRREALGMPRVFQSSIFRPQLEQRDGKQCIYCRSPDAAVIDHIHPIFLGGDDDLGNLGLACRECNGRKAGKPLADAGMSIVVETAARAHESYQPRTLCAPGLDVNSSPELRTQAHTSAHVRQPEKAPLSNNKNTEESKLKRERHRGARLPDDWRPTAIDWALAIELLGEPDANTELLKFKDHWKQQPGSKGVKLDWAAAWRNWTRRAYEYRGNRNGQRNHGAPRRSASSDFFAGMRSLAEDLIGDGEPPRNDEPEIPLGRFNIDAD